MQIHIALVVLALLGAMLSMILWFRCATGRRRPVGAAARESETRYRALFETVGDFIFLYPLTSEDAPAAFLEVNEEACRRLGYSRQELLRLSLSGLLAPVDGPRGLLPQRETLLRDRRLIFEQSMVARSGEQIPLEFRVRLFDLGERPMILVVARDIGDRKRAEQLLSDSKINLARAQAIANVGSWYLDLSTRAMRWSDETFRILGLPENLTPTVNAFLSRIHPEDRDQVLAAWGAAQVGTPYDIEHRIMIGEQVKWVRERAEVHRDAEGKLLRINGTVQDITTDKQHQRQLEWLAHHDSLTHLPNRLLLGDRMRVAFAQADRARKLLAVCYLDLDGFKAVNDTLGHEAGDRLLVEVANRLRDSLRAGDTVSRLGGDEFVLLLAGFDTVEDCEHALMRLLVLLAAPYALTEGTATISASVGVALYPLDRGDPDELLRRADQAMYLAKQNGRNCYRLFG
ncbi:MAG TPA: diguanylate cyclase [Candidatus Competibacter sp.]|nr:diguanylate cyclase [Candidatus Competibacter sp.]